MRSLFWFFLGFLILFTFRLIYGYSITSPQTYDGGAQSSNIDGYGFESWTRKNYASEKNSKVFNNMDSRSDVSRALPAMDQKYEKIGSMSSKSDDFQKDETSVRTTIKKFDALIQFEQNSGMKPNRELRLAIGVDPMKFDSLVVDLKKIGKLTSIRIDKTDKTNEYKELQAKAETLKKSRESMMALKNKAGSIPEMLDLEAKIMELEETIQNSGVKLGEFDTENEFCTVKFSLSENRIIVTTISIIHRIKVALEWTARVYLPVVVAFLIFCLAFWILPKGWVETKKFIQNEIFRKNEPGEKK